MSDVAHLMAQWDLQSTTKNPARWQTENIVKVRFMDNQSIYG